MGPVPPRKRYRQQDTSEGAVPERLLKPSTKAVNEKLMESTLGLETANSVERKTTKEMLNSDGIKRSIKIHQESEFISDKATALSDIYFPPVTRGKGRPRGSELAAIGLRPKKAEPFIKKTAPEQVKHLLELLLEKSVTKLIISGQCKGKEEDLPKDHQSLPQNFMDAVIDIENFKKYFEPNAFAHLNKLIWERRSKGYYECPKCGEEAEHGCVFCDWCLLWYHFECAGRKDEPRVDLWPCSDCK